MALSDQTGYFFQITSSNFVIPTACAAGNYSIGYSFDLIRRGIADVMFAGGADPFSRITFTGFNRLYAMAPEKCQPFDRNRKGMMLGEGAGVLILEEMELAKKRSWKVQGIEFSEYAAKKAREKGLNVKTGTLEKADFNDNSFSLITFWDVVEHLSNPKVTLSSAYRILKKDGVIAINTPDAGSFIAKLLNRGWYSMVPPEHLFLFNQKNLSRLLKEIGFEILFVGKIGKRFTLQYATQIFANKQKSFIFTWLAKFFGNNFLGRLIIPFSPRDNFFLLARKK